jgi:exodeoxyribonuclease VII small subunit
MTNPKSNSELDFAAELKTLEQITEYLESDEVNLDEAIKQFELATQKAARLKKYLEEAELKIETLKQKFDN